jgi:hypothetical protein
MNYSTMSASDLYKVLEQNLNNSKVAYAIMDELENRGLSPLLIEHVDPAEGGLFEFMD